MKKYNILNRKSETMRVRISSELSADMENAAAFFGWTKSKLVRMALNTFLYSGANVPPVIFER